jgi:ubiquinone/menaquinone biosynthesis C-methylase UbiE
VGVWDNTKGGGALREKLATACMGGESVKDNAYDDPRFFQGYRRMREDPQSANELIEQPALRACLPPLEGLEVLELGCGMGQLSLWLAQGGASRVLATDASERMLAVARSERPHERVEYRLCAMEDLSFPPASFDLVVSSLALHYVADHAALVCKVAGWLRPGGRFVYSVEHPTKTAPKDPGKDWARDEEGNELYWPLSDYSEEGPREEEWFAGSVVKHHCKLSSMLNDLVASGMAIERVEEPEETLASGRRKPIFPQNRHRPSVLVVRSAKGTAQGR